jgi:hypothetical protein
MGVAFAGASVCAGVSQLPDDSAAGADVSHAFDSLVAGIALLAVAERVPFVAACVEPRPPREPPRPRSGRAPRPRRESYPPRPLDGRVEPVASPNVLDWSLALGFDFSFELLTSENLETWPGCTVSKWESSELIGELTLGDALNGALKVAVVLLESKQQVNVIPV